MLEPYDEKLSRTVLRGIGDGNSPRLPDQRRLTMEEVYFSDEIEKSPILILDIEKSDEIQKKLHDNGIHFLIDEEPLTANGRVTDHVFFFKDKDKGKVREILNI